MASMLTGVLPKLIGIAAESYIPAVWGMQQERSLHKQSIRLSSVQHIRGIVMSYIDASQEAGRDSMQSETDRNSTLLLLTTLMLGVAFAFVIEGRVTDLGTTATSQAVASVYAASLGVAFATLVVTMMLVYTNQRRVTALMRAELAKRSAIRDIFVLDGVKHEVDLLREMGMQVPHRADQEAMAAGGSGSESPGGRPARPHDGDEAAFAAAPAGVDAAAAAAAAATADKPTLGGMAQHVGQLDAFASCGAREQHLKMGAYLRLSHHDQVYKVARRVVDKMLAVATVSLLVSASCVFGSAMWVFSASVAPTAIFVVALGVGTVLSLYIGLSEARACSRKDGLSCCAMWRMVEHGVPVAAYDVLSYPQVWRRQLQATLSLMASQHNDAEAMSGQQSTLDAAKYLSRKLSRKDIEAAHTQAASGRRLRAAYDDADAYGDDTQVAEEGDAAFFAAMEQEDGDMPDEEAVQDAFSRLAADVTPGRGAHGGAPGPSPWSYKHSRARATAMPDFGGDELVAAISSRQVHSSTSALNRVQLAINIDPFAPLMRDRKTKIVATLGPKTLGVTEDLIRAGVAVARINCSHGDPSYYEKVVSTVRAAVDSINAAGSIDFSDGAREDVCAIAFDTKGPEIRTGMNKDDAELELAPGDEIVLTTNASARESGSADRVFVDWPRLAERIKAKQRVVLDDGVIALDVVSVARSQGEVRCKVVAGGLLGSRKGVHLPGVAVDLPAVSDKDLDDIACAKRLGADFIFASFIREAGQVEAIRALAGPDIQIISKIENKQGVDNFDAILSASDGIMVARGDLGIEVPLERVFLIQKQLIAKCNRAGKPAICATQMLESMTFAPLPTRAECVDVGNACMDGADAVMLSGETAKGKFPVKTVATMAQLCKVAEVSEDSRAATLDVHGAIRNHHAFSPEEALAAAAVHASVDHDAKAILAVTTQGTTARQISKFRPRCPIVCLTFSAKTARALQLCKGVHPLVVPSSFTTEQLLAEGERAIMAMGLARPGEKYLAVHSVSGEPRHGDPKTLLFASIRSKDEEEGTAAAERA